MEIKIDEIEDKDIKRAHDFCMGIFDELGWDKRFNYGLENLKRFFAGGRELFLLAKKGGHIIGCGGLKELSKDNGLLKRFYIAKKHRGKGLGSLMIKKIKNFAKDKEYKAIVLDIHKDNSGIRAKRFYQKHGFEPFTPEFSEKWEESKHPESFEFRKLNIV